MEWIGAPVRTPPIDAKGNWTPVWQRWFSKLPQPKTGLLDTLEILQAASDPQAAGMAEIDDLERATALHSEGCRFLPDTLADLEKRLAALGTCEGGFSHLGAAVAALEKRVAIGEATSSDQATASLAARVAILEALVAKLEVLASLIGPDDPPSDISTARVVTKIADYLAGAESVILCNAAGGAIVITLPPAAGVVYRVYHVKKIDASAFTVTVTPNGAELIDGAATMVLSTPYEDIHIVSNGTGWSIL